MKKVILSVTAWTLLTGIGCVVGIAWGQPGDADSQQEIPHKVGLIDLAYLFNKYEKFNNLREDFKSDFEQAENKVKADAQKIQGLSQELKGLTDVETSSPEYTSKEKTIMDLQLKWESDRQLLQKEFMRKESKIYQTVYQEVLDLVKKYCVRYNYTLILRYNKEEPTTDDPKQMMMSMQKQIVYSRDEDDITEIILKTLNKQYNSKSTTGTPNPAPRRNPADAAPSKTGNIKPAGGKVSVPRSAP